MMRYNFTTGVELQQAIRLTRGLEASIAATRLSGNNPTQLAQRIDRQWSLYVGLPDRALDPQEIRELYRSLEQARAQLGHQHLLAPALLGVLILSLDHPDSPHISREIVRKIIQLDEQPLLWMAEEDLSIPVWDSEAMLDHIATTILIQLQQQEISPQRARNAMRQWGLISGATLTSPSKASATCSNAVSMIENPSEECQQTLKVMLLELSNCQPDRQIWLDETVQRTISQVPDHWHRALQSLVETA